MVKKFQGFFGLKYKPLFISIFLYQRMPYHRALALKVYAKFE